MQRIVEISMTRLGSNAHYLTLLDMLYEVLNSQSDEDWLLRLPVQSYNSSSPLCLCKLELQCIYCLTQLSGGYIYIYIYIYIIYYIDNI